MRFVPRHQTSILCTILDTYKAGMVIGKGCCVKVEDKGLSRDAAT